jgi:hypothetical protein
MADDPIAKLDALNQKALAAGGPERIAKLHQAG